LAHTLIDGGVDLIIGSHPHVIQPVERYGNGLIAYSLGNFVFDQMWSDATRKGAMLDVDLSFSGTQITSINYRTIPVTIYDYGQPRIEPTAH
jgi:poly-gamma-glutamate synthesis protein (capsule biosynthesis protein)